LQDELRGLRLDVKKVLSEAAEVNTTIRSHDEDSTEGLIPVEPLLVLDGDLNGKR